MGSLDKIKVEILPDASLKITTDKISPANHGGAEALIRELVKKMGGKVVQTRRPDVQVQAHQHEHTEH